MDRVKKSGRTKTTGRAKRVSAAKRKPPSATRSRKAAKARKQTSAARPGPQFVVRALDPVARCGAGTTVERLYRVDEAAEDSTVRHLVFLDRHGWYCEHGRGCPAVTHARKFDGARRDNGPTHHGRMRA